MNSSEPKTRILTQVPARLRGLVGKCIDLLPESLSTRLNPAKYGFLPREVPAAPIAPATPVRLYIAPVNFAGQGHAWARAAELLPGVGSVNMHYAVPGDFGFPSDNVVPLPVFHHSRKWQRAQFERVASGFTHVLIEAERPIFGTLFSGDTAAEVRALRQRGVTVGMLSHGSDLRLPSRHREIDEWSPFHDAEWDLIPVLERQAIAHRELLREIGAPVFIATSDLVLDWPEAKLLPIVVDPARWRGGPAPLLRDVPVVVHAPSKAHVKGSHFVDPILEELHEAGLVEYRRIQGVPAAEMPALIKEADIVLEQFRVGNYATAAIEALAAGRLVVGHVHEQVRKHVEAETGYRVPIVEATPLNLRGVIEEVLADRATYRGIAAEGPVFASAVHDGSLSAHVLGTELLGYDGAPVRKEA